SCSTSACSVVLSFWRSALLSGPFSVASISRSSSSTSTSRRRREVFIFLLTQQLTKAACQRQPEHLFNGAVWYVAVGCFATARSPAHQHPVGRAVAGPAKTAGIDEGLGEVDWMAVHPLPVSGQRARY